jgi:signal transduction histidine kinase
MNRSTKFTVRNGTRQPVHVTSPDQATFVPHDIRVHRRIRGLERAAAEHDEHEMHELQRVLRDRARLTEIGATAVKIVHDLGNLLTAISLHAHILVQQTQRGDLDGAAAFERPAKQILTTVQLLQSIVDDFHDFARENRVELHPVALRPLLLECYECWQSQATQCGVSLKLTEGPELPPVRADKVSMRRVLDNLIKNAIEAVGEGPGEVVLSAAIPHRGTVRVAVEDSGPGIPAGLEVFKLFETTKPDGTGIGLAVAKQLVTAHGGSITHESRETGGTRFCIDLPLDGPQAHQPRRAANLFKWCSPGRGLQAKRAS